jgi:protein SCO1/2
MIFSVGENVPFWRNPWFWGFVVGIVCITGIRPLLRRVPDPPPVLFQLPDFVLVDAAGEPFGSGDLEGSAWVVHFFSTRGETASSELMRSIASLQARYDEARVEGIRLAGFSVDPAHDTPERLRRYGADHGVDPRRWTLVTGDPERVRELIENGFEAATTEAIRERFVLVDGAGRIRGFYGTDAMGLDEIFHRSRHVLDEQRN